MDHAAAVLTVGLRGGQRSHGRPAALHYYSFLARCGARSSPTAIARCEYSIMIEECGIGARDSRHEICVPAKVTKRPVIETACHLDALSRSVSPSSTLSPSDRPSPPLPLLILPYIDSHPVLLSPPNSFVWRENAPMIDRICN